MTAMSMVASGTTGSYLQRAPRPSGLADVLDVILDKGLVIDAFVRVSVVGIELLTIDARIVVASVDTYLRYAEAVNRLDLSETDLFRVTNFQEKAAEEVTKGAIEGTKEELTPQSSTARNALKGVAAGALAAGAAAAAKKLADRARETDGASEE
jgi:gas vesicle structural protein